MAGETGLAKTFECPGCGGSVQIRAAGFSLSAVCTQCNSIIDTANANYQIISKSFERVAMRELAIPLGSRGTFGGDPFEVIGFLVRQQQQGYEWREYLLFNPRKGFRWLVESDGHWSFVQMLSSAPKVSGGTAVYGEKLQYKQFSTGTATVQFVLGEFYWRIKLKDQASMVDFIAPPFMLSMEKTDGEITWSHGTYYTREQIRAAFPKLQLSLPYSVGVAPNQPNPHEAELPAVGKWFLIFTGVFLAIQLISPSGFSDNFLLMECLLGAFPFLMFMAGNKFESRRVNGDDYSGDDDDDE